MNKDQVLRIMAIIAGLFVFVIATQFLFNINVFKNGFFAGETSAPNSSSFDYHDGNSTNSDGPDYCYDDCQVQIVEEEVTECTLEYHQETITHYFELRKHFNENMSREIAHKIKVQIDEMKKRAATGTGPNGKGEYVGTIGINRNGSVVNSLECIGVGGGKAPNCPEEIWTNSIIIINIHTHDICSAREGRMTCKDQYGNEVINPDNPPSLNDLKTSLALKLSAPGVRTFDLVVECDGDIYEYSTTKKSVIYKTHICPAEKIDYALDCEDRLEAEYEKVRQLRIDANTVEEANKATDKYLDFLKKNGMIINKVYFTGE